MSAILKLDNQAYEAFYSSWDTDYFKVRSAKAILKEDLSEAEQENVISFSRSYDFVTITNLGNRNLNNMWICRDTNAFLADMNIQFVKQIHSEPNAVDEFTSIFSSFPKNDSVLQIAQKSFMYSRFFNDPWLPKQQAHNIYLHWTECAFDKPDKYFVIRELNNHIVGYLLFSINMDMSIATIELVAVNEDYKGMSTGKSLIGTLESFAYRRGIKLIRVGTQINNVSAARFYTARGFNYESCSSIYHYWPNK